MHYVYLLRSESYPKEEYIGCTTDLKQRMVDHNRGDSPHTSKFVPWRILAYFAFTERQTAIAFERYLKSGSGRALPSVIFINRSRRLATDSQPFPRRLDVPRHKSVPRRFEIQRHVRSRLPQHGGQSLCIFPWHNRVLLTG